MKVTTTLAAAAALPFTALEAAVLWDGRFNDFSSAADLNRWSWANQVGPYQYYIHGSGSVDRYIQLSPDHKNPADAVSRQGARFTLDGTAFWNGQNMRRTELIPQTTAAINRGKVFYHFSMMRKDANAPSASREHQINFFESHFTEMKYGWISGEQGASNPNLQWMTQGQSRWKTEWLAGVWHNVAYEIVSFPSLLYLLPNTLVTPSLGIYIYIMMLAVWKRGETEGGVITDRDSRIGLLGQQGRLLALYRRRPA